MRKLVFVIFAAVALLSFGCDEVGASKNATRTSFVLSGR